MFSCCAYEKDHFLFSDERKQALGVFKNETKGKPIVKFCGLRSKLYTYQVQDGPVVKKAKGVAKPTIKIKKKYFDLFEIALLKNTNRIESMDLIRSHSHPIYIERVYKSCLTSFCDKRFILPDGSTYAFNHYKIEK